MNSASILYYLILFIYYAFCHRLVLHIAHSNNTRAQKWLAIADYRISASTQSTLRGAKHLNTCQIFSFKWYKLPILAKPLQLHNLPFDCAGELSKPSKDSARLQSF